MRAIEEKRGKETVTVNYTGAKPLLAGGKGTGFKLGLPGKGKEFEVVGIPLTKPGFYVVELASPALGQALLGRKATRYVAPPRSSPTWRCISNGAASASLAWVTSLDSGKPVAGAEVRVTDSCTGKLLAAARPTSRAG